MTDNTIIESKKQIIPIMTCFDKNYVIPAAVAFYSLLKNAKRTYTDNKGGGGIII